MTRSVHCLLSASSSHDHLITGLFYTATEMVNKIQRGNIKAEIILLSVEV